MSLTFAQELRATIQSYQPADRESRAYEMIARRAEEVTITMAAKEPDMQMRRFISNAVLGYRFDQGLCLDLRTAEPIHEGGIRLASLLKRCPQCASGACGRVGQFHDIAYKTGQKAVNARGCAQLALQGQRLMNVRQYKVDPDTGIFERLVPAEEAMKIMRQIGEGVVSTRYRDRQNKTGDRWLVRDVAHYELYGSVQTPTCDDDAVQLSATAG